MRNIDKIPDADKINECINQYNNSYNTIHTIRRLRNIWVDQSHLDSNGNYIDVSAKQEAIIADLIINNETKELRVRATYRIPPMEQPYVFYTGYDIEEVQKAFKKIFSSTLEDVQEMDLLTSWEFIS